MPIEASYIYVVRMDIDPEKELEFNEVYDNEHIPIILKVPGVLSASRFKCGSNEEQQYLAIYELTDPSIPETQEFITAAESGSWPTRIRPFTKNRSRVVYRKVYSNMVTND